jgi:hypothetical protein
VVRRAEVMEAKEAKKEGGMGVMEAATVEGAVNRSLPPALAPSSACSVPLRPYGMAS